MSASVELLRALAVLAEPPEPSHARVAEALGLPAPPSPSEHADLFLFQLHPYASVHLGPEGMLGGEARARVAGFWRAVGRTPPSEPDHLSALLGLRAALLEEARELGKDAHAAALVCRSADALLHEHLLPWLPPFLDRVRELGGTHHRAWAGLLDRVLREAAAAADAPSSPPRHLVLAPPLPDPRREGARDFVPTLLAPAVSGLILTRHDLARVARGRGLGLRAGERRYALEHLLGLDPGGVLEEFARLARSRAAAHAAWPQAWSAVREHWAGRARTTAALLEALAREEAVA